MPLRDVLLAFTVAQLLGPHLSSAVHCQHISRPLCAA